MLESWNDGPTTTAIIDFVTAVGDEVAPEHRIAVFDNDGTLWCEKPAYIQLDFIIGRLARKAADDPDLIAEQPYRAASEADLSWFGAAITDHYRGDDTKLTSLAAAVLSLNDSLPVAEHAALVNGFFAEAKHPTLGRPYRECVYAPMVELLRHLEDNAFTCYIVSGGARDFMRPVAEAIYGIPPERIIGSAQGLTFAGDDSGHGDLLIQPTLDVFDDGPEKPVRIWNRIGRRPILSAGNSNGDDEMLVYSGLPDAPALRLVVVHDDPDREFAYTAGAERLLDHAERFGWTTVSMKNDWSCVFGD
jgi:phosphoglycolate phosphatase-like HAD superfamily hydrolase